MSIQMYNSFKSRYDNTVPIRGRQVECRPWSERRRDFEQIAKVLTPLGEGYTARLYNTDVVTVAPNGDIFLKCERWATYTTAEWIRYRSPFMSYKKYGRLWVDVAGRSIPVDSRTTLHIQYNNQTNTYSCDKQVVLKQKVVDRSRSKDVRKTIKPFKEFVKVIAKLSDGWIANETVEMYKVYPEDSNGWRNRYAYVIGGEKFDNWSVRGSRMSVTTATALLGLMQRHEELSDADKMAFVCLLAEGCNTEESRIIATVERTSEWNGQPHSWKEDVREYKYSPTSIINRVDYIMKKASDIYTEKDVVISKPLANLM